jgi:hypothetical protein
LIEQNPTIPTPESFPTESPRHVIVVERRSLMLQSSGVWLVAIPLAIAFWICLAPYHITETPSTHLNLPATDWSTIPKATKVQLKPEPQIPESVKPIPVITKIIIAEKPSEKSTQKATEPEPAKGVVILNRQGMGANPVAVFDQAQKAATEKSSTAEAAIHFNAQPPPSKPLAEETGEALAEIQKAAEAAKVQRERDETLKPLIAVHEEAQSKIRQADRLDQMKRRAESSRKSFIEGLTQILSQNGNVTRKGPMIDQFRRENSEGFDLKYYSSVLKETDSTKKPISTSIKIKRLRAQGVPEPIILAYLIQLEMRDVRKSDGPRDTNDAIVRSAKLLLK